MKSNAEQEPSTGPESIDFDFELINDKSSDENFSIKFCINTLAKVGKSANVPAAFVTKKLCEHLMQFDPFKDSKLQNCSKVSMGFKITRYPEQLLKCAPEREDGAEANTKRPKPDCKNDGTINDALGFEDKPSTSRAACETKTKKDSSYTLVRLGKNKNLYYVSNMPLLPSNIGKPGMTYEYMSKLMDEHPIPSQFSMVMLQCVNSYRVALSLDNEHLYIINVPEDVLKMNQLDVLLTEPYIKVLSKKNHRAATIYLQQHVIRLGMLNYEFKSC